MSVTLFWYGFLRRYGDPVPLVLDHWDISHSASEPIARSSIQSEDLQKKAMARTNVMMPSEPKPMRIHCAAQLIAGLGVNVGLLLKVGVQAAGLLEALSDGRIDEENVVAMWETPVWCTATAVALRVAARQHGACFEALYQRQNEVTKQNEKETAADDLQAEKEPRELSSLHTKHDVNSECLRMTREFSETAVPSLCPN
eukprot:6213770-Pleurochrysis_carterae.AAC.1